MQNKEIHNIRLQFLKREYWSLVTPEVKKLDLSLDENWSKAIYSIKEEYRKKQRNQGGPREISPLGKKSPITIVKCFTIDEIVKHGGEENLKEKIRNKLEEL